MLRIPRGENSEVCEELKRVVEINLAEYWPKVSLWIRSIVRCREVAAELTQEACLRLLSLSGREAIRHPQAFLYRTARNLAFDYLRKYRVEALHLTDFDEAAHVPIDQPSAEQALLDKERVDELLATIRSMPSRCRQVFLMHRLYELRYREIAERLNMSESAVEKNIMRALAHCRRTLQEER